VVLSGRIDRETKSDGFAADYNGLIEVDKIFGLCSQVNIVTQGDLQHHRWVLENIKGVNIALAETGNQAFDLDFGEQMFVVLNTGCHKISGQAKLREQYFSNYISQKSYQPRLNHHSRLQNRRSWFLYQFAHLKPRRLIDRVCRYELLIVALAAGEFVH
jgi:hypothetical protein